jgi:hypothetical protein
MDLDSDDDSIIHVQSAPPGREQVDHPPHYTWHPGGIEAIDVCEAFSYNLGNALAYIWRCGGTVTKGDIETDLEKAIWYLRRELERRRDGRSH